MNIPLAAQAEKLNRILDERVRFYRLGVRRNTLELNVAAEKHAEVDAIRRSFRFLVDNADWIRAEAQRRAALRDAMADPAVTAVMAEFPGATATIMEAST